MNTAVISDRAKKRLKTKHPWIFSNELESKPQAAAGELVRIQEGSGHFVGIGYYNPHTLIAVRILSFREEFDLKSRILKAFQRRQQTYTDPVYRFIYSESDGLPGLIADRYGDTLVMQFLTAGIEKMRQEILDTVIEITGASRILLRNDSPYRELEGLPRNVEWIQGDPIPQAVIEIDGLKIMIHFASGQKTGFFLDQRENRKKLLQYGPAGTMLDVFSYTGAWSLYAAKAGVQHITAVDSSQDALATAEANARLNGYSITTIVSDSVEFLRHHYGTGERYDRIVLDPPAFCRSKRQLEGAVRGYREINLRAMKLLSKDGILFTCSCSQPVVPELFLEIIRQAASDSGRTFHLKELLLHPPDHPVLLNFPESLYLKCAVLQVV